MNESHQSGQSTGVPDELTATAPTAAAPAGTILMSGLLTEKSGHRIGRYKLLQKIGEGGMGSVWMAEQLEPVRRQVALKLIKGGKDSSEVLARFEAERQAVALMEHPNIAKVFDAGATADGRPYFVMELIKGTPITHFCDEQRLSIRERLELFVPVCQAVQHAHQKGIIHRDLKPGNVLVALHDGRPVPTVIDFGVAKATGPRLTEGTLFTEFGAIVGTLEYMSPEQAELNQLDIDTRSDIYSLGVLLYELLTGTTPLTHEALRQGAFGELLRRIREEEPPKPSTRLSQSKDRLASISAQRKLDPGQLKGMVRGDLDWIVMKALDKDRRRRYDSASAFGQDVGRNLRHEPVSAAAPSMIYKFRKFARRNRMTLAAATTIVMLLLVGAAVSTWLAVRATRAEKKAKTEAEISAAVNNFLQNDLLAQASPQNQPDRDLKLRTVVDRAAKKIEGRFTAQPLVEAAIRATMAGTYLSLGEARSAEPHARRSVELYRSQLGPEHPETLKSMNDLADVYQAQGKLPEAEALHVQVVDIQNRVLGPQHIDTLASMNDLAVTYRVEGKLPEAAKLHAKVLDISKRVLGLEHTNTLGSMNNLALTYHYQGKLAEAAALQEQVVDLEKGVLGPEHPNTLASMDNLAYTYQAQSKLGQAATLHAQVVDISKRVLGPEHPATLTSMNNLALAYQAQGKLAEAAALHAQLLEIRKRVLDPEHPDTLQSMHNLAFAYQDLRQVQRGSGTAGAGGEHFKASARPRKLHYAGLDEQPCVHL